VRVPFGLGPPRGHTSIRATALLPYTPRTGLNGVTFWWLLTLRRIVAGLPLRPSTFTLPTLFSFYPASPRSSLPTCEPATTGAFPVVSWLYPLQPRNTVYYSATPTALQFTFLPLHYDVTWRLLCVPFLTLFLLLPDCILPGIAIVYYMPMV